MAPEDASRPFSFSALFQSSPLSALAASTHPKTPSTNSTRSILRENPTASFIGFSWGPTLDAFDDAQKNQPHTTPRAGLETPKPFPRLSVAPSPFDVFQASGVQTTPVPRYPFATPVRPSMHTPYGTLPRPSTVRRTAPRRAVSDREALQQLVNCVGLSARKRVLESGRKPRILGSVGRRDGSLKSLRFDASVMVAGDGGQPERVESLVFSAEASGSGSGVESASALSVGASLSIPESELTFASMDSDGPPSPSPTPRPGSAMSMLSKRSQTPTITSSSLSRIATTASMQSIERRRSLSPSRSATSAVFGNLTQVAYLDPNDVLSDGMFEDLEKRHRRLLQDIDAIEEKLRRISRA